VKLLLDQNLSQHILPKIADLYPQSSHVKNHALDRADDEEVWRFARDNQFVIVSKDSDFFQRALVRGQPPKFIYLRVGNCTTQEIVVFLRREFSTVAQFTGSDEAVLVIS
jgi:predicted nuclease of predicted toxin-antitoxin system